MKPSEDALAIVACQLALKSKYLDEHHDLCEAFWHFYDTLIRNCQQREEYEAIREQTEEQAREVARQQQERWKELEPIIMPELNRALEAGLPRRICNALRQNYIRGFLDKPLLQVSDDELRSCPHIGEASYALILQVRERLKNVGGV